MGSIFIPVLLLFFTYSTYSLCVPLNVKETGGIDRTNVPVQSGIPLPVGKYQVSDLSKFMVLEATGSNQGFPIPSAFAVNATWKDGSIRFLNVQFQATVSSKTTKEYYLTDGNQTVAVDSIIVNGGNGTYEIETGVLKFKVKSTAFNLIDEAFVDLSGAKNYTTGNQIVQSGHAGGFVINGQRSNGGNAVLTLFRATREQIILKATGTIGQFPYVIYIKAFRNKPYVHITHNFYYNNATASSKIDLANLSLELPTKVTGERTAVMGNNSTKPSVQCSQSSTSSVYTMSYSASRTTPCYTHFTGTTAVDSGNSSSNIYLGWMHVNSGSIGIGIGIRHFWEMYPKVLELEADGKAILGLFSYKGPSIPYYAGGGRTHTAIVSFGTDTNLTKEAFFMLSKTK